MSVSLKVFAIVGICLLMLVLVAVTSIWQMARIGEEIESVTTRGLPLTSVLTKVTTHQLEQSINLERAIRAKNIPVSDAEALFTAALKNFDRYAAMVDEELVKATAIAQAARDTADTREAKSLYAEVTVGLKAVKIEHEDFGKHAAKAFAYVQAGETDAAASILPVIEKEEHELNGALEGLLQKVGELTEHAAQVAETHEKFAIKMLIALSIAAMLLGMGLSYYLVRKSISEPLKDIVSGLDALSANDMSVDVRVRSNDEIGAVARAYGTFRDVLSDSKRLAVENERQKREAEEEQRRNMNELANRFEATIGDIVGHVASAAAELNSSAQSMSSLSEETSSQASCVAASSEEAATNVHSVAAASEEMSKSIDEISDQLITASQVSQQAVEQVEHTNDQMSELASTADVIGEVIALISDIADQTNLLALNATIESARAGEAGRGFAVVASEVKALADETGKATGQIGQQIQKIQTSTKAAVSSTGEIGTVIGRINEISATVAAAMEEQSAVTQEITRNVHEAAAGTSEMTRTASGVTQASQEVGAASAQVLSAADELSRQAETLRTEVDVFIARVRSDNSSDEYRKSA